MKTTIFNLIFNIIYNYIMFILLYFRIILESDPASIANRVAFRSDDIPLGEQTVAQVSSLV